MKYRKFILLGFMALAIKSHAQTITDIDGNTYKTIKIGVQSWMEENLKTSRLNDGESIQKIDDPSKWNNSTSSWCWYGNDSLHNNEYGTLYNWPAINTGKVCPAGWHVPTNNEWNLMAAYLGGEEIAGKKMKEADTLHWLSPNAFSDNSSQFSGLPGGFRNQAGEYDSLGGAAYFWTATESDTQFPVSRILRSNHSGLDASHEYDKGYGFSVRCVKDSTIIDTSLVYGTWDKSGSPYIVQKNISIPGGATLNIEAGTEIKFSGYYSLSVIGFINCAGTVSDSVVFSRSDTTGFYNNADSLGGWAGIRFGGNGDESALFRYSIFENGKAVTNTNPLGGIIAINLSTRTYTFENCTFRDNKAQTGGAVFHFCQSVDKGSLSIINCNFTGNQALYSGGAIYSCSWNQKNTLTGNKFLRNVAEYGGGIALNTGITDFRNNLFEGNSATEDGGGIYLNPSTEQNIFNSILSDNYARSGAAISGPLGCYLNIFNSTIVNNSSPGSILYMGNMTGTKITNTILWDPGNSEIVRNYANSDVTVRFSDIKDGADSSWFGETCIDRDPLFISTGPDRYLLSAYSPCINAGSIDTSGLHLPPADYYGNNRIMNERVDMGAAEYQSIIITSKPNYDRDESLLVYPNPVNNIVYFKNENTKDRVDQIRLLNSQGMNISTYETQISDKLDLQSLTPGIYLLNFYFQDGRMITKKIIKE